MLTKKGERMQKILNERDAVASLDWDGAKRISFECKAQYLVYDMIIDNYLTFFLLL